MDTNELAKIFKALSNPNRLELYLKILKSNESKYSASSGCLVTDIIKSLNIGAPTISHHIKELSNAQLIFTEKKGKFLICRINENLAKEVSSLFNI
ncbi:ArsR/SmtB family transcription factor [Sarcina ventriculi]